MGRAIVYGGTGGLAARVRLPSRLQNSEGGAAGAASPARVCGSTRPAAVMPPNCRNRRRFSTPPLRLPCPPPSGGRDTVSLVIGPEQGYLPKVQQGRRHLSVRKGFVAVVAL